MYAGELQRPNKINIYRQNVNKNNGELNARHSAVFPAIYCVRINTVISFIFPSNTGGIIGGKSYKKFDLNTQ
jgi:hypothetical protein